LKKAAPLTYCRSRAIKGATTIRRRPGRSIPYLRARRQEAALPHRVVVRTADGEAIGTGTSAYPASSSAGSADQRTGPRRTAFRRRSPFSYTVVREDCRRSLALTVREPPPCRPRSRASATQPGGLSVPAASTGRSPGPSTARVRLHLKPGQKGTRQLLDQYGDRLVCVRYRYDPQQRKRFKTIEIVVAERDWVPTRPGFTPAQIVALRVPFADATVRQQVKRAGGTWNPERGFWHPPTLRCYIVGENPGDTQSEHFYQRPASYDTDEVAVRRALLRGLSQQALIAEATLEAFRDAGFLFDHAIRCQLSSEVVKSEREKAKRYASTRVDTAAHLLRWLSRAQVVWVMGHLASNAVANATAEFPKQRRRISRSPYPGEAGPDSRFFVWEYLSWRTEAHASAFAESFKRFARARGAF